MRHLTTLITVTALLATTHTGALADLDAGLTAYDKRDFMTAARQFKACLPQVSCAFFLASLYQGGEGVPQDDVQAAKLYKLAAERGHAGSQGQLGSLYESGRGVPRDYKEAAKWYRLAADQGYSGALSLLGDLYARGDGVPKNLVLGYALANFGTAKSDNFIMKQVNTSIRDKIRGRLSQKEISIAQRLSAEMDQSEAISPIIERYLKTGE